MMQRKGLPEARIVQSLERIADLLDEALNLSGWRDRARQASQSEGVQLEPYLDPEKVELLDKLRGEGIKAFDGRVQELAAMSWTQIWDELDQFRLDLREDWLSKQPSAKRSNSD